MKTKTLAVGLTVAPLLIGVVMHFFGAETIVLHWEGSLTDPTSITFNVQNSGLVLLPVFLVGATWLLYLQIRQLFSKRVHKEEKAQL